MRNGKRMWGFCGDWAPGNSDLFQHIVSYRLDEGSLHAVIVTPAPGRLVPADAIRPTDVPEYDYGQPVAPINHPDMRGTIARIDWHFKHNRFVYFIDIDGKRKSRRYFCDELIPLGLETADFQEEADEEHA